jgi:hypothetical protein
MCLTGTHEAVAKLDYQAAAVHVVYQVVAQGNAIGPVVIAQGHNDVVLLKLGQGRSAAFRLVAKAV